MRQQPLIVQAGPTPLANAFTQLSRDILTADPNKSAESAALARKNTAEAAKSEAQLRAMNAVQGKLASIFQQYTADGAPVKPWTNPDTGQVIPNTDTSVPLEPESAARQRFAAARPDIASLYAQLSSDPAKGLTEGLRVGEMYRGTPDSTRLGALLGGDMPGPDFSGTTGEADRIAQRNINHKIQQDSANPSEAQVKGRLIRDNWDNLANLPIEQKKVLGALPSKGFSMTMPDGTVVSMGGTGGTDGLEKPVRGDLQKHAIALDQFDALSNLYEDAVNKAPDSAFGTTGVVLSLANDLGMQANNIADVLAKAGYNIDKTSGETPVSQAMNQTLASALQDKNISPDVQQTIIDAARSGNELMQLNTIMRYKGAGALAGQSGRDSSDRDIKMTENYIINPHSLSANKAKVKQGLEGLKAITRAIRGATPASGIPPVAGATAEAIPTGGSINAPTDIPQASSPAEVEALKQRGVRQFIAPDGKIKDIR